VAYYFHWSREEVLTLPHKERRDWCAEISKINRELSAESGSSGVGKQVRIEDMKF
jgi:hypothetical protein